jgi:hypothetical protein
MGESGHPEVFRATVCLPARLLADESAKSSVARIRLRQWNYPASWLKTRFRENR